MRYDKGMCSLEMAKVTSKGQITIPVSIRRKLNINEGDKLLFIDSPDGILMVNPDMPYKGQAASGFKIPNSELWSGSSPDAPTPDDSAATPAPVVETAEKSGKPKKEPPPAADAAAPTVAVEPPVAAAPPVATEPPVAAAPPEAVEPPVAEPPVAAAPPVAAEPPIAAIIAPPEAEPPAQEPAEEVEKPASRVRGFDLSSLLDDIRSMGSKI